jgi:hypothetical protein
MSNDTDLLIRNSRSHLEVLRRSLALTRRRLAAQRAAVEDAYRILAEAPVDSPLLSAVRTHGAERQSAEGSLGRVDP